MLSPFKSLLALVPSFSHTPYETQQAEGISSTISGGQPYSSSYLVLELIGTNPAAPEIATFASGCFWGTEHIFLKRFPPKENKGILKTSVGYTGGKESSSAPSYRAVCSGMTGHAEAVRIEFDPAVVAYGDLVEFFYRTHDPTSLDSQGNDHGTQYRSAIFTHTPDQAITAREVTAAVQAEHFQGKGKKIVTQIKEAGEWYDAENDHQEYLFKNPGGYQCATHRLWW